MPSPEISVRAAVNDFALPGFDAEHGLSLVVEYGERRFLFDTGQGRALLPNLRRLELDPAKIAFVVLSHGHNDHTGGLVPFYEELEKPIPLYSAPGVTCRRWSFSPPVTPNSLESDCVSCGGPSPGAADPAPREISMPFPSVELCRRLDAAWILRRIERFTQVFPGIYLTGPIPRRSGESAGGAFYFDPDRYYPDTFPDEQAIVLSNGKEGILLHGCCHAGLINTLEYCREQIPELPIRTVIGGLHLLSAGRDRLRRTADYLNRSRVTRLYAIHCTGRAAVDFLRRECPNCEITLPLAGETIYRRTP